MLNNHQLCYRRDSEVLLSINEMGALDLYQIKHLHFPSIRTARRRMEVLAEKKKVNRIRPSIDQPYYYFVGKKPSQLEHRVGTNYARMYMRDKLKAFEFHSWEYEPGQYMPVLRPDGFLAMKNQVTKKLNCYFIEFDRAYNPFDKVEKYNELYETARYKGTWWVDAVDRFPAIIVVSENIDRAQKAMKANKNGLEFRFLSYTDIRRCFGC